MKNTSRCFGCLTAFPVVGKEQQQQKRAEGASESSRYECPSCERHFCVDCDVFCHEVVHNCPGCTSGRLTGGRGEENGGVGAGTDGDVIMNGHGNGNGVAVTT